MSWVAGADVAGVSRKGYMGVLLDTRRVSGFVLEELLGSELF